MRKECALKQASRATVSVSKGMNPSYVQVSQNGGKERLKESSVVRCFGIAKRVDPLVEPFAQFFHQVWNVRWRGAAIDTTYRKGCRSVAARRNMISNFQAVKDLSVLLLDPFWCNLERIATLGGLINIVQRSDHVIDFPLKVLLRRRELLAMIAQLVNLFFGQSVAFDGSGRNSTFD
jgi:hypothetical protein